MRISASHNSQGRKQLSYLHVNYLHNVQDTFRPIAGLFSCAGATTSVCVSHVMQHRWLHTQAGHHLVPGSSLTISPSQSSLYDSARTCAHTQKKVNLCKILNYCLSQILNYCLSHILRNIETLLPALCSAVATSSCKLKSTHVHVYIDMYMKTLVYSTLHVCLVCLP